MRRAENGAVRFGLGIPILLLVSLAACGGTPDFSLESQPVMPASQDGSRSLAIGSLATPPPGDYRFVRLRADGVAEVRELLTVNGPGPWLAYIGRIRVPATIAADALAAIDAAAPASAPGDERAPCVIAFDSPGGTGWQGCAYPGLAARVLSQVPRLSAPEISRACQRRVCQVRLVRELPAATHERTGSIQQEIVVDEGGAFWCAAAGAEQGAQATTLHVERGAIAQSDARRVFDWLTAGVEPAPAGRQPPTVAEAVMARGRGTDWTRLRPLEAGAVRARWRRLADRLPAPCR